MIRAVEVCYFLEDYPDKPSHMAFLSTVNDMFIKFNGTHVWDSWEDLAEDCDDPGFLERVKGLCPAWFKAENKPEGVE